MKIKSHKLILLYDRYIFGRFIQALNGFSGEKQSSSIRAIETYFSLFVFGFLYQIGLTWDALRLKNTIQIVGLCLYNVGLIIYAAVQTTQIDQAILGVVQFSNTNIDANLRSMVWPFLIAVPCVIGFCTILLCLISFQLYKEFAWSIYKHISADMQMRRRYLTYQVCFIFHH